jgi:hypothetical protein
MTDYFGREVLRRRRLRPRQSASADRDRVKATIEALRQMSEVA